MTILSAKDSNGKRVSLDQMVKDKERETARRGDQNRPNVGYVRRRLDH